MSEIITTTARTASTIAAEIRTIHDQARNMLLMYVVEIGKRLVEAKALVDHGEWCNYLQQELGYKQSTANNYMKIYRDYSENGVLANSQTFGNLGYSQALALLALPAGDRETFVQEHDVESMSARELKQAIKERDEARQALAEAKEAAAVTASTLDETQNEMNRLQEAVRKAEQDLLVVQQEAAAAKSSESAWQEEIDKLKASLAKTAASATKAKEQLKKQKENPNIPDAIKQQLVADAAAKAAEQARAELQEQLVSAEQAAQAATREKEAAEARVKDATDKLAAMQKNSQMSNPDVMAFNLLAKQILNDFNRMDGYRLRVVAKNPDMEPKMRAFMKDLAERIRLKSEGSDEKVQ